MSTEEKPRVVCDISSFCDEKIILQKVPVCRRTLYNWRTEGKIPHIVIGRRILFHWPSVEAALLRQQQGGQKA